MSIHPQNSINTFQHFFVYIFTCILWKLQFCFCAFFSLYVCTVAIQTAPRGFKVYSQFSYLSLLGPGSCSWEWV